MSSAHSGPAHGTQRTPKKEVRHSQLSSPTAQKKSTTSRTGLYARDRAERSSAVRRRSGSLEARGRKRSSDHRRRRKKTETASGARRRVIEWRLESAYKLGHTLETPVARIRLSRPPPHGTEINTSKEVNRPSLEPVRVVLRCRHGTSAKRADVGRLPATPHSTRSGGAGRENHLPINAPNVLEIPLDGRSSNIVDQVNGLPVKESISLDGGLASECFAPARACPKNTLLIWDWDDTFLPTYSVAVTYGCGVDDTCPVPKELCSTLSQLERRVLETLQVSLECGTTIFLTNASYRWVADSATKYLPTVWDFVQKHELTILSARDICQSLDVPQTEWKRLIVRDQVETFFAHLDIPASAVSHAIHTLKAAVPTTMSQLADILGTATVVSLSDPHLLEPTKLDLFARALATSPHLDLRLLAMTGLLLCPKEGDPNRSSEIPPANAPVGATRVPIRPAVASQTASRDPTTGHTASLDQRLRRILVQESISRQKKGLSSGCGVADIKTPSAAAASVVPAKQVDQPSSSSVPTEKKGGSFLRIHRESNTHAVYFPSNAEWSLNLPGGNTMLNMCPYVIKSEGDIAYIKDMFPPGSPCQPIACCVISIGDGENEREAVLAAMADWDTNHRNVARYITELRRYIYDGLFQPFMRHLKTSDATATPPTTPCRPPPALLPIMLTALPRRIAWTFKSVKLGSHPTVEELVRTHEALHAAFLVFLKLGWSVDASIVVRSSTQNVCLPPPHQDLASVTTETIGPALGSRAETNV